MQKVKFIVLSLITLLLIGCGIGEKKNKLGSEKNEPLFLNIRAIFTFGKNESGEKKQLIGFLEKYEIISNRDTRQEFYYIFDISHKRIGFVNPFGKFYKYTKSGEMAEFGEYPILPTGLKLFFGVPLEDNLFLSQVEF